LQKSKVTILIDSFGRTVWKIVLKKGGIFDLRLTIFDSDLKNREVLEGVKYLRLL
jgi:hypothetical protein